MTVKTQRAQHKYFREQPSKLRCHHCGEEKAFTVDNFHRDKSVRFGLSTTCRVCRRKHKRENGSDLSRIAKRFGITKELYDQYIRNGTCHICGGVANGMSLDHCHTTGKPRGVLCRACNTGLGCFKDNPALLEAAASYLRQPR